MPLTALLICFIVYSVTASLPFAEDKYFKNVQQLTWGGENVNGDLSPDGKHIVYQGAGVSWYGTYCDQIYEISATEPATQQTAQRISSGIGLATRPKFFPSGEYLLYSTTSLSAHYADNWHTCPHKICATNKTNYDPELYDICAASLIWDLFPEYDVYTVNRFGNAISQLTTEEGYDADADISSDGKNIVFTSMRTGDPEIWIMDSDGLNPKQLTHEIGYDGGATFSHDGTKILFTASRPKTEKELSDYRKLLSYNLVSPLTLEIYMMNIDGSNITQVTKLGGSNISPYFMKGDRRFMFGSNFESADKCGDFSIYMIDLDGTNLQRVTANVGGFDAFPTFDGEQKRFMWTSSRNGTTRGEMNLFMADWILDTR